MRFGIGLPTCREGITQRPGTVTVDGLAEFAVAAERLGLDSLWADDFRAPAPDMKLPYADPPSWYEVLVTLAFVAGRTRRIRLGTGVLVLPLREPTLLAKQIATLDRVSGGRFFLGVGLGVSRGEFVRVSPRRGKARRGDLCDEMLDALDRLLTQPAASFAGRYLAFDEVALNPRPVQRPLPLYFVSLGKDSPKNLERLARWGTGVLVSSDPDEARRRIGEIADVLARAGRDIAEIDVCAYGTMSLGRTREAALALYQSSRVADRTRAMSDAQVLARHYIGTAADVLEKIDALAAAGITHVVANTFPVDEHAARLEQLEWYGTEVVGAVAARRP